VQGKGRIGKMLKDTQVTAEQVEGSQSVLPRPTSKITSRLLCIPKII